MSADHYEFSRANVTIDAQNDASVETSDQELSNAITVGVNDDIMDFKKLIIWSGLGVGIVASVVVIWIFASQMFFEQSKVNATATSTYYAIDKLTEDANNHIQSYGVLDAEKGVYHMPVDAAIEKIATQD
tara:strand:- start:1099 stop:1488 length:390 start_codon:yes stop_codon:yes gene_type:complete